jgi:hypothetical protein
LADNIFSSLCSNITPLEIRKTVISEEKNFGSNYQNLLRELFEIIYESSLSEEKKKTIMLDLGEHIYRDNFVLDHEINFFCCILNIKKYF